MAETKKQSARKRNRARRSDRIFVAAILICTLSVFVWVVHDSKNDADNSIDPEHVEAQKLVKVHSPSSGPKSAQVTVVEFFDLECAPCRSAFFVVKRLQEESGDKLKFVFRHYPLHRNSRFAAAALEEARLQGRFEEAFQLLLEKQNEWGGHGNSRPELIQGYLANIGIDISKYSYDQLIEKHSGNIGIDESDAKQIGIRKMPTFFVNGRMLMTGKYEFLKKAIEDASKVAILR